MKAIDFFCGAGGLTRGLRAAGIDVVAGVDIDASCRKSYEENNRPSKFSESDIHEVKRGDLVGLLPELDGASESVLFAGCAPCQPFSQQRRKGSQGKGATLLGQFGRLVSECEPGAVLVENVPGIARVGGFSTFRRFLRMLEESGYGVAFKVLDAKDYGVPQNRQRLILIANRMGTASLPEPTHGKSRVPHATVRQAIGRFPAIGHGECHPTIPNHVAASISEVNVERLKATPHDGGDRTAWPSNLTLECHNKKNAGHTDVYGRMFWERPAPALTGRCHSISNGRYGHPTQDRAISLREAAALQTFPDDYVFYGVNKRIALQIGNAVPVLLAEKLGHHVLSLAEEATPSRYRG